MRRRILSIIAMLAGLLFMQVAGHEARAQDPALTPLPPTACPAVAGTSADDASTSDATSSEAADDPAWNACDKWVWHCIRQGGEANLFAKECAELRSDRSRELRRVYKYAPFTDPDTYSETNGLSKNFVYDILTKSQYANILPASGIRIVGGYFAEAVNLENVSTDKNLVFDQSIFKKGVRLTNFRSDRNFSLDGSNVRGAFYLKRANLGGTLFFEEAVFDLLDASDARFAASVDGPGSVFNAPFRLDRVRVEGKVSLIRARLTELTAFDTEIGSKLELRHADVRGRIDLTGAKVSGDVRMQRLKFGRVVSDKPGISCDWDLTDHKNYFFLAPTREEFAGHRDLYEKILQEAIYSRPGVYNPDYPCLRQDAEAAPGSTPQNAATSAYKPTIEHEVLIRDMKIGGALCLIDITGKVDAPDTGTGKSPDVSAITLDGTEARTTILRWAPTKSTTLWQAVHFTTRNLYLDLGNRPNRYLFDNLNLGNVSFLKAPEGLEAIEQVEDSRSYLCDTPSGPSARYASDAPETHERIISFFNSAANKSSSAQPFGEIVKRLESSGSASIRLKVAYTDYKFESLCQNSEFFKRLENENAGSVIASPRSMFRVANTLMSENKFAPLDEARRIGLDIACKPMLAAYKYTVSYGYEPLNILYLIIVFIMLFWALLRLDKPLHMAPEGRPPRLGLLYAIDMFNPFTQVRINHDHGRWQPQARWLRVYLAFHRFLGFVLCILLAVGIYGAGQSTGP